MDGCGWRELHFFFQLDVQSHLFVQSDLASEINFLSTSLEICLSVRWK